MPDFADRENPTTLVLFDVDGTLTPSRQQASEEMLELLEKLRKKVVIGFVGGSDLSKQMEQIGMDGMARGDWEGGAEKERKGKEGD